MSLFLGGEELGVLPFVLFSLFDVRALKVSTRVSWESRNAHLCFLPAAQSSGAAVRGALGLA